MMSFPLEAFAARGTGAGPRVTAWLARIHARPATGRRWSGADLTPTPDRGRPAGILARPAIQPLADVARRARPGIPRPAGPPPTGRPRSGSGAEPAPHRRGPGSTCRSPRAGSGSPRDVRHEGDRRAELAHRLGEGEHGARDAAGQAERQRHGQEDRERARPRVPAACSSLGSTASIDSRIARTMSGNPITAQARAAPVHRKAKTMPISASAPPRTPRRRARAAAGSRSPPGAGSAAGGPARRAARGPGNGVAPAATPRRGPEAGSPAWRRSPPAGSGRRRSRRRGAAEQGRGSSGRRRASRPV